MNERRKRHRRHYRLITRFPLLTESGEKIAEERRLIPTRRLNDISVREISRTDYLSGLK
jgi:hypothetical protein